MTYTSKKTTQIKKYFGVVYGCHTDEIVIYIGCAEPSDELKVKYTHQVSDLITDLMLAPKFPVPSTGKWDKTGAACDMLFLSFQNNFLAGCMEIGLERLNYSERVVVDEMELEQTTAEFNRVVGVKAKDARAFSRNKEDKISLAKFIIIDEPSSYLVHKHLQYAHMPLQYVKGQPTPVHVWANDKRSPIYQSLLGCSAIMHGVATCLVLRYRNRNCSNNSADRVSRH